MSKASILMKWHIPVEERFIQIYLTSSSTQLVVYLLREISFTARTSIDIITIRTKETLGFASPGLYLDYSDFFS